VPNLSADRAFFVSGLGWKVDVRRLMYQTLICRVVGRYRGPDKSRSLAPALDAKLFQGAADSLVDGVGADAQVGGDFLTAMVPIDQQQAFDLPLAEARNQRLRAVRTLVLFDTIGNHHEHQHSFRAGNMCKNLRLPANPLVESAEMLKFR
jgi:hypothetical protein